MSKIKKPKIFIIAGEVSGDVLGARIMRQMPDVEFVGIGGENMMAAGLSPIFPLGDLAIMGIAEVVFHARTLTHRIHQTIAAIIEQKPDMVLTIDSPGFARSVITGLRKSKLGTELITHGMRFHHFVAPQVWAWRASRAKKYAKTFDKLYAFFDFELPYFTKYGLDTMAVGHPIADELLNKKHPARKSDEKIIALIPGSRLGEVERLMPLMQDVAQQLVADKYIGYRFVIPTVETTDKYVRAHVKKWSVPVEIVPSESRYDLYEKTYIAIAASGTVSAELAMMHVPAIIVYKMNPITVWLARRLIDIKWVSLVNILLNRTVYPELLGNDANTENVLNQVQQLTIPSVREKMIMGLKSADKIWRRDNGGAISMIADDIRKTIKSEK